MSQLVDETPVVPTARKMGLTHRLYTGDISYDFIGRRKLWYTISGALLVISLLALVFLRLNLGIEFKGGADFQAPVTVTSTTVDDVKAAVLGLDLPDMDDLSVVTLGDSTVRVQTRTLATEEVTLVRGALAELGGTTPENVAYNLIGASWGQQITSKAFLALGVFLVLVMLLIWGYFRDWKMSVAAIVALLHDLLLTIGIYALVGFSVTPTTLIGVLTILGYSLYDTVVVFDKVRENVKNIREQDRTYTAAANTAINQVLVRSLNTTIIGVLPVAAILFAGAFVLRTGPLEDLGLALFVGMIAGAYSSIFIATPLLAQLRELEPEMKDHREALAHRASRKNQRVKTKVSTVTTTDVPTVAAAPVDASLDFVTTTPVARVQPQRTTRDKRRK